MATFTVARAMEIQIGDEIDKVGANIVVTPRTELIGVPYGNVVLGSTTIPESSIEKVYTIPNRGNLRALSPKLYGNIQYRNSTLLIVGIVPEKETQLKRWWNLAGSWPQNDTSQVVSGSTLASSLRLTVGSAVTIRNEVFTVVGILGETGSVDDYSLFLLLHTAQRLLNLFGKISVIDVGAICKDCPVELISQQIMDAVPNVKATPIRQAVEARVKAVEQMANFSLLLASIILVVGCAGIMNTMLGSVHERMREIGTLMSLGADNIHLWKMFVFQAVILGLVGGVIGILVGLVSAIVAGPLVIRATVSLAELVNINPYYLSIFPISIAASVLSCLVASVYPTWRASKIDPVLALRAV